MELIGSKFDKVTNVDQQEIFAQNRTCPEGLELFPGVGQTEKLEIEPASAQLELRLGLSLAKFQIGCQHELRSHGCTRVGDKVFISLGTKG